jgi:type I restriction enzyme S subunit
VRAGDGSAEADGNALSWVKAIPSHWRVAPLKTAVLCLDNLRIPKNAEERAEMQGDIPYWGANSVQGFVDRALVHGPLILVGEDGAPFFDPLASVAFAVEGPIWPNNHVHVLKALPGFDYRFLTACLNAVDYSLYVKGSTRDKLNQSELMSIAIPLPPYAEQQALADFLDRETGEIDAFIQDQEQLIRLLQERRAATISHALDHSSDSADGLKVWSVVQVRYVVDSIRSGVSVNAADWPAETGEIGILKTSSVYSGQFNAKENKTVDPGEISRVACAVREGSIIVSRMNTPQLVGAAGFVAEAAPNLYLPDRLWQIQVTCNPRFFHYWTLTSLYRSQVKAAAVGTSSSMQNLSQSSFARFAFPLPSREAQNEIVNQLDNETRDLDLAIEDARVAMMLSLERRSALISAAVTGKIDMREHVGV